MAKISLSPRSRCWLRGMAVVLLTFHAASIAHVLLPQTKLKSHLAPLFETYRKLTGTDQRWDMFVSKPRFHSYEVSVEIPKSEALVESFGPVIPGLQELPDYFRYQTYFTRIDEARFGAYQLPYVESVRQELLAQGQTGKEFFVRTAYQQVHDLGIIRTTGEITQVKEATKQGPYPLIQPVSIAP